MHVLRYPSLAGTRAFATAGLAFAVANLTGYAAIIGFAGALQVRTESMVVLACDQFQNQALTPVFLAQTLVGQAYGAGNYRLVGLSLQRCLLLLWLLCIPISIVWLTANPLLVLLGKAQGLAFSTSKFLRILTIGLWLNSVMVALLEWMRLQSHVTGPFVCIAIVAILHIPLTHFLVNIMGLGLQGAAVAVSTSHALELLLAFMFIYMAGLHLRTWVPWSKDSFREWAPMLRLAIPSFFMMTEWWTSEFLLLMAASLMDSDAAVAAITIYHTTNSLASILPLGLSISAAARVSNQLGAGNHKGAKFSSQVTVFWGLIIGSFTGIAIFVWGRDWCMIFDKDPEVVEMALTTLYVLIPQVVLDGVQTSVAGIMRGTGQQSHAAMVLCISYFLIGLPSAFFLGYVRDLGAFGLCAGYMMGDIAHFVGYMALWLRTNWKGQGKKAQERVHVSDAPPSRHKSRELVDIRVEQTESPTIKTSDTDGSALMQTVDLSTLRLPRWEGSTVSEASSAITPLRNGPTLPTEELPVTPKMCSTPASRVSICATVQAYAYVFEQLFGQRVASFLLTCIALMQWFGLFVPRAGMSSQLEVVQKNEKSVRLNSLSTQ
ncbi:hypothetical protein BSKO_12843 [Bryopsis sp. KO-2023]|nr:hypothetical protein BSKO_12843 [Bryopsis sp. KO-2023]